MRQRKFYASRLLAITAMLLAVSGIALADLQETDNDIFSPGNQNIQGLTAAPGATVNTTAQITITRSGSNHLPDGATVTFDVSTSQTTLPNSPAYSVSSVVGTVPSNWSSQGSQTQAAMGTSNISFTAPSTAGLYQYAVKWNASGPACIDENPSCLTGSNDLTINLTVEEEQACTYTATFLAPLDQSTPAAFIGNTFKKGRVLPVKAHVFCGTEITPANSSLVPYITTETATFVAKATDAVETFSDAGSSSAGTTNMRWSTDGFWIYNYDTSKGLTVGTTYNVFVNVDSTKITNTFVALVPTK